MQLMFNFGRRRVIVGSCIMPLNSELSTGSVANKESHQASGHRELALALVEVSPLLENTGR